MTKFDVLKSITEVKEYSQLIYELVKKSGSPEKLQEELTKELPESSIKTLLQIARNGNYPLSLDGMQ